MHLQPPSRSSDPAAYYMYLSWPFPIHFIFYSMYMYFHFQCAEVDHTAPANGDLVSGFQADHAHQSTLSPSASQRPTPLCTALLHQTQVKRWLRAIAAANQDNVAGRSDNAGPKSGRRLRRRSGFEPAFRDLCLSQKGKPCFFSAAIHSGLTRGRYSQQDK